MRIHLRDAQSLQKAEVWGPATGAGPCRPDRNVGAAVLFLPAVIQLRAMKLRTKTAAAAAAFAAFFW